MTYQLEVRCPKCSGPLRKINGTVNTTLTVAVVVCDKDRDQYEIDVRIKPMAWTTSELKEFTEQRKTA